MTFPFRGRVFDWIGWINPAGLGLEPQYVGSNNQKEFMVDLKRVYKAINKDLAASELDILADKWNDKYPIVIKSWRNNWERLSQYFKYPTDIRRIIYTTT